MQPISEAPQETSLRDISQRIAIGVGPDVETKADRCGCPAPLLDRDVSKLATLDPPELTTRHTDGCPSCVLAHARGSAGQPDLAADLMIEVPELRKRSVQATISSRHVTHREEARSSADHLGIRAGSSRSERARPGSGSSINGQPESAPLAAGTAKSVDVRPAHRVRA
jgi:hypothetical protein